MIVRNDKDKIETSDKYTYFSIKSKPNGSSTGFYIRVKEDGVIDVYFPFSEISLVDDSDELVVS